MYSRHCGILFGVLLGLTAQPAHTQPVRIPAEGRVAPVRWDIGNGVCVTAAHVQTPPLGKIPFPTVEDALSVLNQTSQLLVEDSRVNTNRSLISFRNNDPLAVGDFSSSTLFPFSDNAGAIAPNNDSNFAVRVRGYLNVGSGAPAQLLRTLGLYADDGARLNIGGTRITLPDIDQRLAARRVQQVQYGASGLYPIELVYYQNGSLAVLELSQTSQLLTQTAQLTSLQSLGFELIGEPRANLFANTDLYTSRSGAAPQCLECSSDSACSAGNYCVKDWGPVEPAGLCEPCNVSDHCGSTCQACGASTPICSPGGCVQCVSDSQCDAGGRCDLTTHSCRALGADLEYFGGCSAVRIASRQPGATQLGLLAGAGVLLFLLYRLRRRWPGRGLGILSLGVVALWPLGARADLSANTQTFQPAIGPENIITVEGTRTGQSLRPLFNVLLDYSQRPLRLVDGYSGLNVANTVPDAISVHLMAGMGITRWLSLAADLPVVVYQGFDRATPVQDVRTQPSPYGIGDLRLVSKFRIINNERGGFGLAFVPQVTFPTGDPLQLRSNDAYAIEPRLAMDYRTTGGAIIALNAGFLGRTASQVLRGMEVGSQVRYGLGVYLPLPESFGVMGEVAGGTSITSIPGGNIYSPLEGNLGGRWAHSSGFTVSVGGGTGFTPAVGSPQFRMFASVGYLPLGPRPAAPPPTTRVPAQLPATNRASQNNLRIGIEFARAEDPKSTLTVEKTGDGVGMVATDSAGISCGKVCMSSFRTDQELRLTALPDKDSRFAGWEGPCTGIEPCTLLVRGDTRVWARFVKKQILVTEAKLDLQGRVIHFETAKSDIDLDSYYLLDEVALILRQQPQMQLRIEGHTDSRPFYAPGGNLQLSADRAAAVVKYLISRGVSGVRLSNQGYGDICPVATNQTTNGQQANRRTEFLLVDPATGKYQRTPCIPYTVAPAPRLRKSATAAPRATRAVRAASKAAAQQ